MRIFECVHLLVMVAYLTLTGIAQEAAYYPDDILVPEL